MRLPQQRVVMHGNRRFLEYFDLALRLGFVIITRGFSFYGFARMRRCPMTRQNKNFASV